MTRLMEQAFDEASRLSDDEQDAIASILLREIASVRRWDVLFAESEATDILARLSANPFVSAGARESYRAAPSN